MELSEATHFYLVDNRGIVTPISRETYEELPSDDPRLDGVPYTSPQRAYRESLKRRGIDCGYPNMRN